MRNKNINRASPRRDFLKTTGTVAAATTLVAATVPNVHAQASSTVKIALVGCGGRGTGAAKNALSVPNESIQLMAMADVFDVRLNASYGSLSAQIKDKEKVAVLDEHKYIGFDAYKKAMDVLSPGDIVILTTPPAFRWLHYTYAIEKGLNVFMEKPVTVDAPTSRRMLELNKKATAKNLKVAVGLMCRHCKARQELFQRIQDGEIGEVNMVRAYRMAGRTGSADVKPKPDGMSELMFQIRNFHGFLWLSGGAVSDFLIHNIDESCWMKNAWPVDVKGTGGRHYRGDNVDQNFDTYSMEYTFSDGTKLFVNGRTMPGCHSEFASYAHGSKGLGVISSAAHTPAKCRIYKGHNEDSTNLQWSYPQPELNPYQLEWNDLIHAIRQDLPYNEVERGVMASAVTSMGRMAAHTGQKITLDDFMKGEHEFAPNLADLTLDGESPLKTLPNGKYSVPLPGIVKDQEYL
ncbi:MAG: Gfo/Idh/MocA family oxidoreductase [Pirellulaceae bacterium]